MEVFGWLFAVIMLGAGFRAFQMSMLKQRDPARWAAIREAEEREKAAKLASRANLVGVGWRLFQNFRGS